MSKIPTEVWVLPRPRKDCYVGSFPLHFEQKLWRLLGCPKDVLHPFGGLAEIGHSIDQNKSTYPRFVGDAHDLSDLRKRNGHRHSIGDNSYDLVVLDPPYSDDESYWLYGTGSLRPSQYVAEAVRVARVGAHIAIYHVRQPARPKGTRLVHRIVILTRTNHTARICFVFQKMSAKEIAQYAKEAK